MTKEQILEKIANEKSYESWGECMYDTHEHSQIEYACEAMQEYADQELAKEREKAKKLVESAKNVLLCERDGQLVSGILSLHILELKQSLTEYEKS